MGIDDALQRRQQSEARQTQRADAQARAAAAANERVDALARDFLSPRRSRPAPLPVGYLEFARSPWGRVLGDGLRGRWMWRPVGLSGWEVSDGATLLTDGSVIVATWFSGTVTVAFGEDRQAAPGPCLAVNWFRGEPGSDSRGLTIAQDTSVQPRRWVDVPPPEAWESDDEYVGKWVAHAEERYSDLFASLLSNGHHGDRIPAPPRR